MPLHARRRRLKEFAAREAAGEELWTEEFSSSVRRRLSTIVREVLYFNNPRDVCLSIQDQFEVELGVGIDLSLYGQWESNLVSTFSGEIASDLYPSLIEGLLNALDDPEDNFSDQFEIEVNELFAEERIAFRLVNGQMVEFDSMEMHTAVVEPTIRLLHGAEGWGEVEQAYRDALSEIGSDPSDAITDVGRALEGALKVAGAQGNALGPLVKDAKKHGLLAPHDGALTDGIAKLMDWVSADRSELGDAHASGAPTRDDAWLAVHVVGALILRLASTGSKRGSDR